MKLVYLYRTSSNLGGNPGGDTRTKTAIPSYFSPSFFFKRKKKEKKKRKKLKAYAPFGAFTDVIKAIFSSWLEPNE